MSSANYPSVVMFEFAIGAKVESDTGKVGIIRAAKVNCSGIQYLVDLCDDCQEWWFPEYALKEKL